MIAEGSFENDNAILPSLELEEIDEVGPYSTTRNLESAILKLPKVSPRRLKSMEVNVEIHDNPYDIESLSIQSSLPVLIQELSIERVKYDSSEMEANNVETDVHYASKKGGTNSEEGNLWIFPLPHCVTMQIMFHSELLYHLVWEASTTLMSTI